jgi:AraC-like DNA-binding protein
MYRHGIVSATGATPVFRGPREPSNSDEIVLTEREWRILPVPQAAASARQGVLATRWQTVLPRVLEASADTADDSHVVKIVLRNMNMRLSVGGRTVQDGVATPGLVHVTEPGARVHSLFRGAYDVLHLHVPSALVMECANDVSGSQEISLCRTGPPAKDPLIERLARALIAADEITPSFGALYVDCLSVAIVARLMASAYGADDCKRPRAGQLVRWRLKRAFDYVEAHLSEPVRLADLASASGLTRMHFAAQFRGATGLSPHEYLLRRRVERAQEMLAGSGIPVVEVALSVGFQTQSHFTTVFKRFAGQPPQTWRRERGEASALGSIAS